MRENIKAWWDYIQSLFDIDGDMIMAIFTSAIVYKIVSHGLNASDAAAYASAISCFAYSNKSGGKPS
jgi:hypothetical protein